LAKLVLDRPDVLLLDEPTTHLDLTTLEAVEAAFRGFPGAMLFVSHDRYFLDRLAGRLLLLGDGGVRAIAGPYHKYRETLGSALPVAPESEVGGRHAPARTGGQGGPLSKEGQLRPGPRTVERNSSDQRHRPARKAGSVEGSDRTPPAREASADEIMQRIATLEQEVKDLSRAMGDPELYRDAARARQTVQRYEAVTAALEALYGTLEHADGPGHA